MSKKIIAADSTPTLLVVLVIYGIANFVGEILKVAANGTCMTYLGCVDGFFGYDAMEHLLGGIAITFLILWIANRFPKYSFVNEKRWKTIVICIAIVALVGTAWEAIEFTQDSYFRYVIHEPIFNPQKGIDLLAQPSDADTVGDEFFAVVGACIAAVVLTRKKK